VIAALPMYDRPENRAAHDALWALIRDGLRARGVEAPDALDRETDYMEGWGRPNLVLGQICNLPWRARFRDRVTLIGARFALNDPLSNSGWDLPQDWARQAGVTLRPVALTGSHLGSLSAVAEGRADLAGIDAITFRNLQRWEPLAARLRVVARTATSPGMSFITAPGRDPGPYREAIREAIAAVPAWASEDLGLRGLIVLPPSAYDRPLPPAPLVEEPWPA
jgi:hypothetical protein